MSKNKICAETNARNVKPRVEGGELLPTVDSSSAAYGPHPSSGTDAPSLDTAVQRTAQEADSENRQLTDDFHTLITTLTRELKAHQERQRK